MAIAFAGASSVSNASALGSHVITIPAGVSACNCLVAALCFNGAPGTVTAPTGWTLAGSAVGQANPKTWMYYRSATGTETSSCTWATSTSIVSGTGIAWYTGVDSTVVEANGRTTDGAAATSASLNGVTTTNNGAMIVSAVGVNSGTTTITIADDVVTEQAYEVGGKKLEHDYGLLATAGQSGSVYYTFSQSRAWAGVVMALKPASAAGGAAVTRAGYLKPMGIW